MNIPNRFAGSSSIWAESSGCALGAGVDAAGRLFDGGDRLGRLFDGGDGEDRLRRLFDGGDCDRLLDGEGFSS